MLQYAFVDHVSFSQYYSFATVKFTRNSDITKTSVPDGYDLY